MGLLRAVVSATGSALSDQWKEFFTCDAFAPGVLAVRGVKRNRKNNRGNDNVITSGSGVVVADGQCMLIVDQGRVMEVCAEPGEYTYDSFTEPSIFSGGLGSGIAETFKSIGRRISYGGSAGADQRVYYFNTKEIPGNLFGTPTPVPFRIFDRNTGLDLDTKLRCNGTYSIRICDPLLFYMNVCGNVATSFTMSGEFATQLKSEFCDALQPALGKLSEMGIRYSSIPAHVTEMRDAINAALREKWIEKRGICIESIAMNPPSIPPEDERLIKQTQTTAVNRNAGMAAATLVNAQANAMGAAAQNGGGAMMGFMGMNMAQQAGGVNAGQLFQMAQNQDAQNAPQQTPQNAGGWKCSCGAVNTGKFCAECGKPRPAQEGWTCECGAVNKGKFCPECGKPKPAGAPLYRCDKCGWEPEDPMHPPKFCPECGDVFDENDVRN